MEGRKDEWYGLYWIVLDWIGMEWNRMNGWKEWIDGSENGMEGRMDEMGWDG